MLYSRGQVMVVDEDSRRRRLVSDYLRHEGYEPTTAADGGQALEMLEAGPQPAAMICDASALRDEFAAEVQSRAAKVLVVTDAGDRAAPVGSLRRPFQLIDLGAKLLLLLRGKARSSPER
jgi:DNA-binding response OmpR family regulator